MLKDQVLIPLVSQTWASGSRSSQNSIDRAVDRCAKNVHTDLAWRPIDRVVDRWI